MNNTLNISWKPVLGFDNYKVSSQGIIKSNRGSIIKAEKYNGRKRVHLVKTLYDGTILRKTAYVDLIVLLSFKEIPYDFPRLEVEHLNDNMLDNSIDNLQWKKVHNKFAKPIKEYGIYLILGNDEFLVKTLTSYKDIQSQIGIYITNVKQFLDKDKVYTSPINNNRYKIRTLEYDY